ncbi:MAG: PAS domain-containing sensor histidine kinase [Saprospiraceae bacterium]
MKELENDYSKELEIRFKAVMEVALDGIITIDEQGFIESINNSACKLFEYEEAEIIGCKINQLMPMPFTREHDAYLEKYKKSNEKKIIGIGREVKGMKKNGTIFPLFLNVNEVTIEGRKIFTGVIHDISAIKKAESDIIEMNLLLEEKIEERTEQLAETVNQLLKTNYELKKQIKEREAAEEALRSKETELEEALAREKELSELKSRFITMASHEFRTPLSTILSSVSLIERYSSTEQQIQREKHIAKIKKAVENLTGMLSDILSLSRLEEGRFHIKPVEFEIQSFCHEVIEEMQGLMKPNQTIICNVSEKTIHVCTDNKILKNILYNLLSNAIKYSEKEIICTLSEQNDTFSLKIEDKGIGISDDDQKQLFDRFYRASNALNIQGTGLGLNIVKKYVDVLNGELTFNSQLGAGSTFIVKLPKIHI